MVHVLNISSFLNPCFKTLAHLPLSTQDETIEKLKDILLECLEVTPNSPAHTFTEATVEQGQLGEETQQNCPQCPAGKCRKVHPLEKLLGSKFRTDRPRILHNFKE